MDEMKINLYVLPSKHPQAWNKDSYAKKKYKLDICVTKLSALHKT
jgi:hypothetical protein